MKRAWRVTCHAQRRTALFGTCLRAQTFCAVATPHIHNVTVKIHRRAPQEPFLNVHRQFINEKTPLPVIFLNLQRYAENYKHTRHANSNKLSQAVQTFYYFCSQDAALLSSEFRKQILKYQKMQLQKNQSLFWRSDAILVSVIRLYLVENDYSSAIELVDQRIQATEKAIVDPIQQIKGSFRIFGQVFSYEAQNGYFLEAYERWQKIKELFKIEWTEAMEDTLVDMIIGCLQYHSQKNQRFAFENQMSSLLSDLRYASPQLQNHTIDKISKAFQAQNYHAQRIHIPSIQAGQVHCPHCNSKLVNETISKKEWERMLYSIESRPINPNSKRQSSDICVAQALAHFKNWLLEKHKTRKPHHCHYILDGPNIAYLNQNFSQGSFRFDHIDMIANSLDSQGHLVSITLPAVYLDPSFLIRVRSRKNRRNKSGAFMRLPTTNRTEQELRMIEHWKARNWLYSIAGSSVSDDVYWVYASILIGQDSSNSDPSDAYPARIVTNDQSRDHLMALHASERIGMNTQETSTVNEHISKHLLERWRDKTFVNVYVRHEEQNYMDSSRQAVEIFQLKHPNAYSRIPQMKVLKGTERYSFHLPIHSESDGANGEWLCLSSCGQLYQRIYQNRRP